MYEIDEESSLDDPRVKKLLGDSATVALASLNYKSIADVYVGMQVHEEAFRQLLVDRYDALDVQFKSLASVGTVGALADAATRQQLALTHHNPIEELRYAMLYAIPGVAEVCRMPERGRMFADVIVYLELREYYTADLRLDEYKSETGERIAVEIARAGCV